MRQSVDSVGMMSRGMFISIMAGFATVGVIGVLETPKKGPKSSPAAVRDIDVQPGDAKSPVDIARPDGAQQRRKDSRIADESQTTVENID